MPAAGIGAALDQPQDPDRGLAVERQEMVLLGLQIGIEVADGDPCDAEGHGLRGRLGSGTKAKWGVKA